MDIRRATMRHFSAEDKIRIVLEGLRGEDSIAELCRKAETFGLEVETAVPTSGAPDTKQHWHRRDHSTRAGSVAVVGIS
jgi:transposase